MGSVYADLAQHSFKVGDILRVKPQGARLENGEVLRIIEQYVADSPQVDKIEQVAIQYEMMGLVCFIEKCEQEDINPYTKLGLNHTKRANHIRISEVSRNWVRACPIYEDKKE